MIEVIYDGNLGNNLFQYCFGRIIAQTLGYELSAEPIPGFPRTRDRVSGNNYSRQNKIILRGQKPDLTFMTERNPLYHVMVTGYFQRYEYYKNHLEDIREWLESDYKCVESDIGANDVVIGIRRGRDYIPRHGLPISYYEKALSLLKYKRLHITTNEPNDPFIKYFVKKYDAKVRPPGAIDNLEFIKKFKKIIISNSTFLWWAAVLSDADKIICPRPANGFWSANDHLSKHISLEISDPRYTYLECEKYKSIFLSEIIENAADRSVHSFKSGIKKVFPFIRKQYVRDPNAPIFTEDLNTLE